MASHEVNNGIISGLQGLSYVFENEVFNFPMSDGGDGMNSVYSSYRHCKPIKVQVRDPLGNVRTSRLVFEEDHGVVLIEGALVSGLQMIPKKDRNLFRSWSFGTGDAIKQAASFNPKKIIFGMGGSGVADLGIGALVSLGAIIEIGGKKTSIEEGRTLDLLENISNIELEPVFETLGNIELVFLNDVCNPLLGADGAAAVFGPQKGASEKDVERIEYISQRFVDLIRRKFDVDANVSGVGAAGGLSAGFLCHENTHLRLGADFFLEVTGILDHIKDGDLLITGEGRFDHTSIYKKLPTYLSSEVRKRTQNITLIGAFGQNKNVADCSKFFDWDFSIFEEKAQLEVAELQRDTPRLLVAMGEEIARKINLS